MFVEPEQAQPNIVSKKEYWALIGRLRSADQVTNYLFDPTM